MVRTPQRTAPFVYLSADSPTPTSPHGSPPEAAALLQACRALLTPLAQLAIARGLHHAELDELLRAALVEAALAAHPDVAPHRAVSRVSTATGLHRREVTRLLQQDAPPAARPTPATQVFTRWLSDPAWHADGAPLPSLPRTGAGRSFEALAQSVTKNVHARSLLEELCRLGLTRLDETGERVELMSERYAPAGDEPRMLGFLASNVGDHLRAAVDNITAAQPRHLEQGLFADELSAESLQRLQPLVREQWQHLLRTLAPAVQKLIDDDAAAGRVQDQRVRVGLYAYSAAMNPEASNGPTNAPATAPDAAPVAPAPKKAARRRSA